MILADKRIVLGVTGGIAAYKAAMVCSRLVQAGAVAEVVMTEAAHRFIAPLTFEALTHRPVYTGMFTAEIPHITLAQAADLVLIVPVTANTLAKLACGQADNLLTALALATPAPLLLAPAMESRMWDHPATQANIETLQKRKINLVGPGSGRLASGSEGGGRMAEPDEIVGAARQLLGQKTGPLAGWQVVVTAGGTREAIDPVRFISNHSSGKMGYAIAEVARDWGANPILITTLDRPVPFGVEAVRVDSAAAMLEAVLEATGQADLLVMAAAVADFRPESAAPQKIKKKAGTDRMRLELVRNPDILAEVAKQKEAGKGPRLTVGFAAETEELVANAKSKLEKKRLDLIAANDVTAPGSGFAADTNQVTLLDARGGVETLPLMSKVEVAAAILKRAQQL